MKALIESRRKGLLVKVLQFILITLMVVFVMGYFMSKVSKFVS